MGMRTMAMLDTLVHGETAFLARVKREIRITETTLGPESGFEPGHRVVFEKPRVSDYRASVADIAEYSAHSFVRTGNSANGTSRKEAVERSTIAWWLVN